MDTSKRVIYARKKAKERRNKTENGSSKQKAFEYFDNMQFLHPFIRKRRYKVNIIRKKSFLDPKRILMLNIIIYI